MEPVTPPGSVHVPGGGARAASRAAGVPPVARPPARQAPAQAARQAANGASAAAQSPGRGYAGLVWALPAYLAFLPTGGVVAAPWADRPGPAAAQRHGHGLRLTERSRRLALRRAGGPAPEAAAPLRARLPMPPSSTGPGRAGSGERGHHAGSDGRGAQS